MARIARPIVDGTGGRIVVGRKHQDHCEFPWEDCNCMEQRTKDELKIYLEIARDVAADALLKLGQGLTGLSKIVRSDEKV